MTCELARKPTTFTPGACHQPKTAQRSKRTSLKFNVGGHRAVSWYCRAQRAIRLKPLRCTAFVRRHHWKRCLINVAIIQQSTELVWPSQTNATEGDRITRPDCRRNPDSLQRSSRAQDSAAELFDCIGVKRRTVDMTGRRPCGIHLKSPYASLRVHVMVRRVFA